MAEHRLPTSGANMKKEQRVPVRGQNSRSRGKAMRAAEAKTGRGAKTILEDTTEIVEVDRSSA